MTIVWNTAPQGTEEWKNARRGAITGSRAKDARDRVDLLTKQQGIYVAALRRGEPVEVAMAEAGYKNKPTAEGITKALAGHPLTEFAAAAHAYAMDLARERVGGIVLDTYSTQPMRIGQAEEQPGRVHFEDVTGLLVEQAGFAHTDDNHFGVSVDGLIDPDDLWENKVMVSSATLFKSVVDGDISEYRDQCVFAMWLLRKRRVYLHLYVYDLPELSRIVVIDRNEDEIQALEDDMVAFDRLVESYADKLRALQPDDLRNLTAPPWEEPTAPAAPAQPAPPVRPETTAADLAAIDF